MDNFAITAADAVSRRYKSNDPEAIIAQRAIKIKDIRFCEELLGFYTVLLNCEYIGINPNCSKQQRRSALAHELGHAIFDRKHAACEKLSNCHNLLIMRNDKKDYRNSQHFAFAF